jgi:ketosteroid isomerase-like protein
MAERAIDGFRRLTEGTLQVQQEGDAGAMTQRPPPTVDRRSGLDRRSRPLDAERVISSDPPSESTRRAAPFAWSPSLERLRPRDPWVSLVRRAIADYEAGGLDDLARSWDDGVVWRVVADWPDADANGPRGVMEYHAALSEATAGTFRQELISLDANGGPIVVGHVRTTAARNGRRLAMPSLLTFEVVAMRVARVTEIPGDAAEWDGFWRD